LALGPEIFHTAVESTKLVYNYTVYQLKHPALNNIYYCVLIAYVVCFVFEVILPKQRQHGVLSRKGFWLDTFYVFFNDVVVYIIGLFAVCAVTELIFLKIAGLFGFHSLKVCDITGWNPLLQIAIMFVIQDFCEFLAHYLLHRSDVLWTFHKIHHAQETLGAGSTRRFHFVEMFVFKPIIYIPFAMIGYSVADYFLFQITVQNVWGFFTHMNIKVKWGFINYIVNTPQTHSWHHAKNIPRHYGVNYASILSIWDLMFGTFYLPKEEEPQLGVPDQKDMPVTFVKQLVYPFKQIAAGKHKTPTQNLPKKKT
jgi:sterol desaturase/sphingolipid hydroxylase (fatty acid hydroxylase superfamily)